jgi:hypothetical protein
MEYTGNIKVITNENNLAIAFMESWGNKCGFVFDTDHNGLKYIMIPNVDKVYYDNNSGATCAFCTTTIGNAVDDMVYIEDMYLLESDSIKGFAKSMRRIFNDSLSTGNFNLIEVDGVRYRQIYNQYWILDN